MKLPFIPMVAAWALVAAFPAMAQPRPMVLEDIFSLKRVADPQISPDGARIAYVVTEVLKEENRTNADLWVAKADGTGEPRRLTAAPKRDASPRWSPDGQWIAFESARDGETQIFLLPATGGGEARKLTTISTGAAQPVWSPDGKSLAFVSAVLPEFSAQPFKEADRRNKEKADAREKSKVKARVIDALLYRHWDSWVDDKRQHIFVVGVNADGSAAGEPRNVTPGDNDAVPTSSTFSSGLEFAWSPDGREIAFSAPPLPLREQAWRTNHDVWTVNLATGEKKNVTTTSPGADGRPRYSPDGKWLAYRAQARAGFEADKWTLHVIERATGRARALTAAWDRSVDSFTWAPDSQTIYLEAQDQGTRPLWRVALAGGEPRPLITGGANSEIAVAPDGQWFAFLRASFTQPPEIARWRVGDGEPAALTKTNAAAVAALALPRPESVTVAGAGGTPVQMFILKPPGFDAAKKYPLVFWVHGGPQSAFIDAWSTRWNPQLWAAQGYVIALPNPRGSTGFGQQFTDEISHDWGGKVFTDLMACLAHLEKQPYIDTARMAAAGASYGGYMMNWFQGHTDKFKTLVTHCGVYDFVSMYGGTEETWFDEWDHGIPWENPDFEKWSPHRHAAKFKTPNLVIHNELDFRVPIGQGLSLFTTLQRRGVPSKFLYFPDEGHWVLKPQNSELWHRTIFDWLAEYLKK
ncbi:MAG: S9 family peptidase [Opitutaceae bacterium]|nr:S9 family peptidase [Opitutaceae bacterium]